MKLLNRDEFLKLPEGTFFCDGQPFAFGSLMIKGDSLDNGCFWEWQLNYPDGDQDALYTLEKGASLPVDQSLSKNSPWDDTTTRIYLVYEKSDLEYLRQRVDEAIKIYQK